MRPVAGRPAARRPPATPKSDEALPGGLGSGRISHKRYGISADLLASSSTIAIPGGGFDPEAWSIEAGGAWGGGGGGAGGTRGGGGGGGGSSSKIFMPLPVGLNSGCRLTTPQGSGRQVSKILWIAVCTRLTVVADGTAVEELVWFLKIRRKGAMANACSSQLKCLFDTRYSLVYCPPSGLEKG